MTTETTILIIMVATVLLGLLVMILINRGLNREVSAMVRAYQNLSKQVDDLKDDNQNTAQTLQGAIQIFGDLISRNQTQSAESMDKRLLELNNRFGNMAVENEQKLENIRLNLERQLAGMRTSTEEKLENVRLTTEKKIGDMTAENNKQLEQMRQTVDEKLQETLNKRISESFKQVSDQLEQVYKGLGEMQNLAVGVGDLKKVLSNVKTRGILGEVQLGAILEQILSPEQYEENVVTRPGSTERVEFAVKLPGDEDGTVWLPIDAKFPGDAYGKLVDAYEQGDPVMIEAAAKQLETVIKAEAKDIHNKYIEPPYTTEFGIMFLPFEGLYAEVVRRGLVEVLQRDYKVNIAGPTTMAALLNSLQMGFRTLAIQKHSSEVWKVLGAVKTEFEKFDTVLAATQNRLTQANAELDKLIGVRTRSIQRKLRGVEALGSAESAELLDLAGLPERSGDE